MPYGSPAARGKANDGMSADAGRGQQLSDLRPQACLMIIIGASVIVSRSSHESSLAQDNLKDHRSSQDKILMPS